MKQSFVFLALVCLAPAAFAGENGGYKLMDVNFSAPVVSNPNALTNQPAGTIVFDNSTNRFMGLDGFGAWTPMSYATGSAVLSDSNDKVERLSFAEGTPCTTTPCTPTRQSGSWIASVDRSATGQYGIHINPGIFSAAPTCTATAAVGFVYFPVGANTSTLVVLQVVDTTLAASDQTNINLICQGPQ